MRGERLLPRSVRGRLLLLLLGVVVPVVLVQAGIFYRRFENRQAQVFQTNIDVARASAVAFDGYVRSVLRQEVAIGQDITSPQKPLDLVNQNLAVDAGADPSLRELSWIDASGQIIASSNPPVIGLDISDREYFQTIAQGQEWAVSDLLQARVGEGPIFIIARGVRDERGALLGLVIATVLPQELGQVTLPNELGGQGAIRIVDRQGLLVYRRPEVDLTWDQRNQLPSEPALAQALAGQEVNDTFTSPLDGRERLAGLVPIRSIGWVVATSVPLSEALAPMIDDIVVEVGALILVLALAFLTALLLSRTISTPIRQLEKQAGALARGEHIGEPEIRGPVELESLSGTFRRMADEIATREERLREMAAIVESSDDAISGKTLEGIIVSWNHAAERLYGYSAEEIKGRSVSTIIPADRPDELTGILERIKRGEEVEHYETVRVRKDGRPVDVSVTVSPIKDASGKIVGASTIARDITERKRAEAERERLLREVQHLATETQRHAAELDVANRELEAFAYSVSHDLRAPLRHIDGFSQALLEDYADKLDETGREYLGFVRESTQTMGRLIDDLLKLSRVTRKEMIHEPVDLSAMAEQLVGELQEQQPRREAQFVITPGLVASGDPGLLRVAMENLLANAWKFTSKRPVTRIEFGVKEQDGRHVYFVRDNGVGFDMSYVGKLFGAFQRLHSTEEFPGTGIGLATVQRIIRRHGGRVWAEGEVGKGATFYFTLD